MKNILDCKSVQGAEVEQSCPLSAIKPTYKQSGYLFTLETYCGNLALYRGVTPKGSEQYEVHKLRLKTPYGGGEKVWTHPSTGTWGAHGFTFSKRDDAYSKLLELANACSSMTVSSRNACKPA